jgi:signal transduction histidine kinase
MDRESEFDAQAIREALIDLSRTLDSLRERLEPRERTQSQSELTPPHRRAAAEADAQALGIVYDLLSPLSVGLQPGEMFAHALDRLARPLAIERAMLFVVDAGEGRLVARAARGFRKEDLGSIVVAPGEGIVGRAFAERRLLEYPGAGHVEAQDAFIERMRLREAIALPVRAGDDVAGILLVGRHRPEAFSASDTVLLLAIADRIGHGLGRQAELDREARRTRYLVDVRRFAERLSSTAVLSDVLEDACEIGRRLANVAAAAVAVEAGTDELTVLAAQGLPLAGSGRRTVSVRAGLTAELYAGNEFVACEDLRSRPIPERSFLADGGFRGCLLVPLKPAVGGSGVLYLADTAAHEFAEEEIEAARALAALVAHALDRSRIPGTRDASADPRATQVEKVRVLGEMAGGLARELNNVFAIILGKSRLVLARANDEPLREGLTALEEAAWRGADVVHRLGALIAPSQDETPGAVDMVALVRDVVAEARSSWKHDVEGGGASIDVVADLQAGPLVRGNETVLREVLLSLVVNAVDAMGSGGRLTLSTRADDRGMTVVIEDTGEGIRDDLRERAFDPFFTTRSPRRLGLGLTVAEGVVLRYGGRIGISSLHPPRHGTRVAVWLPENTNPGNPPAPAAQSDVEKDPTRAQGNPRRSVQLEPPGEPTSAPPSNGVPKAETAHTARHRKR